MKLVIASSNAGKLAEFTHIFAETLPDWRILPQSQFNVEDATETGLTFIENAILKARHAAQMTGLPALADDSGLCVDALDGAPGIHSARYAGEPANPVANIDKLLAALRDVPEARRNARFHCALVLLRHAHDPEPLIAEGHWQGRILPAPRGKGGFGYDPVFFDPVLGKSAAELAPSEKHRVSHRGCALKALQERLHYTIAADGHMLLSRAYRAVDADWVQQLNELVRDVEIDLDAPLSADPE